MHNQKRVRDLQAIIRVRVHRDNNSKQHDIYEFVQQETEIIEKYLRIAALTAVVSPTTAVLQTAYCLIITFKSNIIKRPLKNNIGYDE